MRLLSLPLLCLMASTMLTFARNVEKIVYVATDGTRYIWDVTADGAVFVAPEAQQSDQYRLIEDCVVTHATLGTGSWGVDEAGWQISFNNRYVLYFPGPLPPLNADHCLMLR
jgi:hypothetical protein